MARGRKKGVNTIETKVKSGKISMAKLFKHFMKTAAALQEAKAKKVAEKEATKAEKKARREEARALKGLGKKDRESAALKRGLRQEIFAEMWADADTFFAKKRAKLEKAKV